MVAAVCADVLQSAAAARVIPLRQAIASRRLSARNVRSCAYDEGLIGKETVQQWRVRTGKSMIKFMLPALMLPLSDPLMTIIDTVCIGRFSGTLELASLGPSSFIFSFFSYVFNALGVATIACVGEGLKADDRARASRTTSTALAIAIACGLLSTVVMQVFGAQAIAATGAAMELRAPALEYLRIRAFAQPALLVCIVTQSALLAQRDSVSPSSAVALQVVVNLALDVLTIVGLGWGVKGAAWGTVVAQYLGMALLVARLRSGGIISLRLGIPAKEDLLLLWKTLAPLSVVYVAKNLSYLSIQMAAATLVPLQLAAHQAVWAMFNLCAFTNTTLEQAGLAFHPLARTGKEVVETVKIIISMGIANGAILGGICFLIATAYPFAFTSDPAVFPSMALIAPFCALTVLLVGSDVGACANLIALGKADYLARSFVICLSVLAPFMFAVVQNGWGIIGVWSGLLLFFALRCGQSMFAVLRMPIWGSSDDGTKTARPQLA